MTGMTNTVNVAVYLLLLHMEICSLQFRVEVFASLQGSSQHCSLWVDPHVLLRPAKNFTDGRGKSLQQLIKCWPI